MNEDLLREDWRQKTITAGDLFDIFTERTQDGMAAETRWKAEAKCAVLTPAEICEEVGFRHVCGGSVIGCRCYQNWDSRLTDSERERLHRHMTAYRDYIKKE